MGVDCMRNSDSVGCRMACAVWQSVQTGAFRLPAAIALTVSAGLVVVVDLGVAGAAGLGDVGLEGGAGWIFVAEDVVRSVAALAIGRDQQAFLAQREAVNRIHVVRIDAGQALLRGHGAVAVALAAGLGHVQRIDGGAGVSLGKDLVRIAVAAGAGMLFGRGVNAAGELRCFVGVAGFAVDLGDVVGMRDIP